MAALGTRGFFGHLAHLDVLVGGTLDRWRRLVDEHQRSLARAGS